MAHGFVETKRSQCSTLTTMNPEASLVKQGAEAVSSLDVSLKIIPIAAVINFPPPPTQRVYTTPFLGLPHGCIAKQRFSKAYRHPVLDTKITARRVTQEARCLLKCLRAGLDAPTVYFVDVEGSTIYMENVLGKTVRDVLLEGIKTTEEDVGEFFMGLFRVMDGVICAQK